MKIHLAILLFLTIISTGCYSIETVESTSVSANDVYQSYAIRSDKSRTSVFVVFRVGAKSGATIDLDAPSKIEHNSKLMPEIAPTGWKGTTYEESENKFTGNHQFLYTDASGKSYRNEISVEPLEFGGNSFKVNRTSETLIPLSRSVAENETVSAYISGKAKPNKNKSNEDSSDSVDLRLDSLRSSIAIKPDDLKNLSDGKASLHLKVEKTVPLRQAGTKGGEIEISYEAQGITLKIVK